MGVSNPGRTYGGYSKGYNWSNEARLAGQISRATPAERKHWNDYIDKMRSEQVAEPSEKNPGLDDEIDASIAAREERTRKSWLPFERGKMYRTIKGLSAFCEMIWKNGQAGFVLPGGAKFIALSTGELLSGPGFDIIGPWNGALADMIPPAGFQWTGEFRLPKKGDYFTPINFENEVLWHGVSEVEKGTKYKHENDKRYILIKLPKA